jgi:hypothetical protein
MTGDSVKSLRISTKNEIIGHSNVQDAFYDLFGNPNTPGNFVKLKKGKLSYDVLPPADIQINGWVLSNLVGKVHRTVLNKSLIKRLDIFLRDLLPSYIAYGGSEYLLNGDLPRPDKKLAYALYDDGVSPVSMSVSIYGANKKLVRIDFYADMTTFNPDGSGRNGYTTLEYDNTGKLQSTIYTILDGE